MKIAGMLRVKNEAEWIERSLRSILPVCSRIYVMDDHSVDETVRLAGQFQEVSVFRSRFAGLDEARDKEWLCRKICRELKPDWILSIDGDEILVTEDAKKLMAACEEGHGKAYSLRILYLWDREGQIRTDGIYGRFRRPSLFRTGLMDFRYLQTGNGGNFHCSSVPAERLGQSSPLDVRLLHYGYIRKEQRMRKFFWYNEKDPGNAQEDQYLHMIQGDVPEVPATVRLKWAGPLKLEAL